MIWIGIIAAMLLIWVLLIFIRDARRPSMDAPPFTDGSTTTGYTVMLCHRRKKWSSRSRFNKNWGDMRAEYIRSARDRIGCDSYEQVHQISRWSPIYNIILFSRGWPVIALLSIIYGIPVPRKTTLNREARDERWDAIEIFKFSGFQSAVHFLEDPSLQDVRADLLAQLDGVIRRSHVITLRSSEAYMSDRCRAQGIYTVFTLRGRPHIGGRGAMDYWLYSHRPFVLELQPVLQYGAYSQHISAHLTPQLPKRQALGSELTVHAGDPWDGVATLKHISFKNLASGLANPRIVVSNTALVNDEARFIDTGRSSLLVGRPLHRMEQAQY